ncbi:MAG: undecaprenyldiphospho-muramoylpentapeptide beta-N-acetylglucosaminyltransferase [Alphaproteobacteria bacterium]
MTVSDNRTRIVLAAGGTGGHMFPAYAVAEALIERGYRPVLVTDERGARYSAAAIEIERHLLPAANVSRGRISGVVNLIRASFAAARLFGKIRPSLVMGFGGYAALPALVAARLRNIPRCIHEQNAVLGRVNRAIGGSVQGIALSFEETRRLKPALKERAMVTGNPVRDEVTALYAVPYEAPVADGPLRLLVLGGSQGAKILSDVVPQALASLPDRLRRRISVTQQCRPETLDEVRRIYEDTGIKHDLAAFFSDMPDRLADAHLVIARSGASTISELEIAARPSILVPLKIATDDHQTANADGLVRAGGAWVLAEREFTSASLSEKLAELLDKPDELAAAADVARTLARPDAASRLADMVEGLLGGKAAHELTLPKRNGHSENSAALMAEAH